MRPVPRPSVRSDSAVRLLRAASLFEPAPYWQAWKTSAERQASLYTAANRQQAAELEVEVQKIAADRAAKLAVHMAEASEKELTKFDEPLRTELRAAYHTPADQRSDQQKQLLEKYPRANLTEGVLYQYNQAAAIEEVRRTDRRRAGEEAAGRIPAGAC